MNESRAWHVVPTDDLIRHDVSTDDCVCVPAVEAVLRPDGSIGWITTHHSLDGRELTEKK